VPAAVETEAARQAFLADGRCDVGGAGVAPAVLASWKRSAAGGVDPQRARARYVGYGPVAPLVAGAEEVVAAALAGTGASVVLLDPAGVVRMRLDGGTGTALAGVLDALLVVPGYVHDESTVGTTAASVALHEDDDVALCGPEHYATALTCLDEAAALVRDGEGHVVGVVVVLGHAAQATSLRLPLARLLASRLTERAADEPHRRSRALLDAFRRADAGGGWVLATDGEVLLTNAAARHLDGADLRILSDRVLAGSVLRDFSRSHVDLPAGGCAELELSPVEVGGEPVGCLLTGATVSAARSSFVTAAVAEAVRRQGSHVAPTTRRDYAEDLRRGDRTDREHAEARVRANRELLSPFLRAQEEVAASLSRWRNHLLIGEPGVGKRTLLTARFRQLHPRGRIVTVDCGAVGGATDPGDPVRPLLDGVDGRPQLLVLRGLNTLSPVGARRLDEALRPLVALPSPPLVAGCVDTPAVDATRPYGLLLRHFHEMTRIPALRYRADEIGDIALAILRRLAAGRSLRLSLTVVRVLEGYAWPGNISELEDVLRYVVARKPLGEIQPPDLPALCFAGRARRLSMLESAQCDAIIQALYESRGNRYKAASMLGIARSSLYRKIDAFGISYIA
jgi:transcriptional regulator of acetoin/glycerol metabolism